MAAEYTANDHGLEKTSSIVKDWKSFSDSLEEFRRAKYPVLCKLKCSSVQYPSNAGSEETFADSSPLEYYSEIPRSVRLDRFYSLLEIGDVIEGHVCRKIPLAIEGIIDRFSDPRKKRYIQDLDIRCVLKITDMGKSHSEQEVVYNDFRHGDVFKAVVKKLDKDSFVHVSLRDDHLNSSNSHMQLGYMEHKHPPSPTLPPRNKDYQHELLRDAGFHNPGCVKNVIGVLGIDCNGPKSFFQSSTGPPYPKAEYADELRLDQRRRYSTEFTASGVKYMKEGKELQAKKCLDQALDVDSSNVEALVARGALHANKKRFEEAIDDFKAALKLDSEHKNAKKYLASTHTAFARELEKEGKIVTSLKHYQAALSTDQEFPEHKIAMERLTTLKGVLERQMEEEKRKSKEERILKKALRKIMHKKKKYKKDKHKSRKDHKKKHRKHSHTESHKGLSKKKSRSKDSSNSEHDSTSSPESEDYSSSSSGSHHHSHRSEGKYSKSSSRHK